MTARCSTAWMAHGFAAVGGVPGGHGGFGLGAFRVLMVSRCSAFRWYRVEREFSMDEACYGTLSRAVASAYLR